MTPISINKKAFQADTENDNNESNESETDSSKSNGPSFDDEMNQWELESACREYAEWAISEYDTFENLNINNIDIEVSDKLKRTAGKAGGASKISYDWFMRFAYGAYQKWGWSKEFEATIRHELIHVVQFEERGEGGHGIDFRRMADSVDAPRHCEKFTEYRFKIRCSECDDVVSGKYRACKMTRQPEKYRSQCCSAKCYSEEV